MIKATEKLVVQNKILVHQNKALHEALIGEKKRRKRGKAMGLFDKNNPGEAKFFSLSKVEAVRQRARDMEAQKKQERIEASNRRTEKAFERDQKARDVQERKETRIRQREEKRLQKEHEKEDRCTARLAKQQLRRDQLEQKKQDKVQKTQSKRVIEVDEEICSKRQKTTTSCSGRKINLPMRFRD
jgi:DNA anti-recombination protein RmuC